MSRDDATHTGWEFGNTAVLSDRYLRDGEVAAEIRAVFPTEAEVQTHFLLWIAGEDKPRTLETTWFDRARAMADQILGISR